MTGGVAYFIHWIQSGVPSNTGISDEFIPTIVKLDQLDSIVKVSDGDEKIAWMLRAHLK